jgi:glyoxylase-like metal-dependent hydrolase (beta-lactamase superfamily II)
MRTRLIEMDALRQRLERGDDLTVLDVRPESERDEWFIPGSLHHDAYFALASGDPAALRDVDLPADRPVVTVCAMGRTSVLAADRLTARGYEALSLEGGMKAWSLAWNTAEIVTPEATLVQLRRTGKGCLSYLVGSGGEAVAVDPSVAPEVYLRLAAERGWKISHVLDTHIHADHLSRSKALAELAGAKHWLPAQERANFPHRSLADGDRLEVGSITIEVIRTPGHTMESTCYRVGDQWLLTGDTLFPAAVGRPDLAAAAPEEARKRALALFASLQRLFGLDQNFMVLAGHSDLPAEFDRRVIGARLAEARKAVNIPADAGQFADSLLKRIPPTPPNYHTIVALNEAGILPGGDPTDLEAGANRCAVA